MGSEAVQNKVRLVNSASIRPAVDAVNKIRLAASSDSFRDLARVFLLFFLTAATLSLLAQSPADSFASLVSSADAARQQGDIPRAIQLYREATERDPNWPDGWWFLGILQYDANQYVPAREALSRYLQLTPNAAPALALKGLCEFNTADYPQSLQDLELGDSLGAASQPRNARIIFYHEALLLTRLGRLEEALSKFALLAKQRADNQDLVVAIGLAGLRLNLLPKDVLPGQEPLLSSIGQAAVLLMNQDYDGSRQAFQAIFAQYPHLSNIHYLYGYLLFATKPDQAVEQFQEELAISPHSASAHAMLAWAHGLQGDYAASLDDAAKASIEDPTLTMGQLVYGRALVETDDISGGLPHLENVVRSEPGNLEAHLALAKAYSKLGRSEEARRERLLCLSISQQGAPPIAAP
jgi:tetratricopeptide (TPR) repeat protein